jgi:hypothetical protein
MSDEGTTKKSSFEKKRHDLGADMPISFKIRLLIWKITSK